MRKSQGMRITIIHSFKRDTSRNAPKIVLGVTCFLIFLSGCATKVVREYCATPVYVPYNEPIIQKVKDANSVPIWAVIVITFVASFLLFMAINAFMWKRKP